MKHVRSKEVRNLTWPNTNTLYIQIQIHCIYTYKYKYIVYTNTNTLYIQIQIHCVYTNINEARPVINLTSAVQLGESQHISLIFSY